MCGIAGIKNISSNQPIQPGTILQMIGMVRHRGPDGFGIYHDANVCLGSARLSIIDLPGGDQPICNEDGSTWIVFNGEIFNYLELRSNLEKSGHQFTTNSDTEVIIHLYEDYGPGCLQYLNGQFAIAIWDRNKQRMFLARDRLGIRPLFYTMHDGQLVFGSEIKSILAIPGIHAEINPIALEQIFTYWSTLTPNTAFKDIFEIPPGHYLIAEDEEINIQAYWSLDFTPNSNSSITIHDYMDELESLLVDATKIRLRADVPVGAYLSGGLDSSTIAAIIRNFTGTHLDTFSISFDDPNFDESRFQLRMANFLGTQHQVVYTRYADIGTIFPEVIWHTETPLLRTAPAPMYYLSKLVHDNHYKVVLTGEGADEFLAGYDIFKEAMIRRFWAEDPGSKTRPELLKRLYPDIPAMRDGSTYLTSFFGMDLGDTEAPDYSHRLRWRNTSRAKRFFSDQLRSEIDTLNSNLRQQVNYPANFDRWDPLGQAQYLESTIFLPQYLLSSQGDRMAMANSVEGRFPFLDYRVVEFCCHLPSQHKLLGLAEKYILKRLSNKWLPAEITTRPKRPYRAPIHQCFYNQSTTPEYMPELLSSQSLAASGLFNPDAVQQLISKLQAGKRLGETDDMALAGIVSSQLLWQQYVLDFNKHPSIPASTNEITRICEGNRVIFGANREI
jgi:asparagine synthase (glutamine-hydrolysing)